MSIINNIILIVALITAYWIGINFYRDWAGNFGTTFQKFWATMYNSATIAVTKIGGAISSIFIILAHVAFGLKDNQEANDQIKALFEMLHYGQYFAIYTIGLLLVVYIARTSNKSKDPVIIPSNKQDIGNQ